MNVLTVPRTVAALEYRALRYPSQLLATKVVAARLPEESGLRLAYERFLGSLDSKAGALLKDDALADRGRALTRRADVLEKAVALEEKAAQRKAEADSTLRSETKAAQDRREAATQEREQQRVQAAGDKRAAQAAADRNAAERKKAEAKAVAARTKAKLDAERTRADEQQARIDAQTSTRTAAPKAQLDEAVEDTRTAAQRKDDADELARLAEQEKLSRAKG